MSGVGILELMFLVDGMLFLISGMALCQDLPAQEEAAMAGCNRVERSCLCRRSD